jgi:hypothetical protein
MKGEIKIKGKEWLPQAPLHATAPYLAKAF